MVPRTPKALISTLQLSKLGLLCWLSWMASCHRAGRRKEVRSTWHPEGIGENTMNLGIFNGG